MAEELIDLGNGFWNIRGVLRLGGLVNVGTHTSLVQLSPGRFAFLDSYGFGADIARQVMTLTDQGHGVEAILNLHPFHTLHCKTMHAMFPQAQLFGSERHWRKWPDLPWQADPVESPQVAARFPALRFSLPRGIDYIARNERIHAGSLLAFHPASGTVHVDDTLNVLPIPALLRRLLRLPRLGFHPTLAQALHKRPEAAQEFRAWALDLARDWQDATTVCAAHSAILKIAPGGFPDLVHQALAAAEPALQRAAARRA